MKASELRIGIWVYLFGDAIQLTKEHLIYLLNKDSLPEPITLTEEWLLKFGFEKDYDGCLTLLIGKSRFQWSNGILLWQQTSYNDWSEFPCGHVHQLQNLYFALTGTELEIK